MMVGFAPWVNEGRVVKTIPGYYWTILDHLHQRVHMLDHVDMAVGGNCTSGTMDIPASERRMNP